MNKPLTYSRIEPDEVKKIGGVPSVKLTRDGFLHLQHVAIGRGLDGIRIDLNEMRLPANTTSPRSSTLAEQPKLSGYLVQVINQYLARNQVSKSTHLTIIRLVRTYAKFFEYGWLNHRFELSDWCASDTDSLATKLAEGGWVRALDIPSRIKKTVSSTSVETWRSIWRKNRHGETVIVPSEFRKVFCTNIATREIYAIKVWCANHMAGMLPALEILARNQAPFEGKSAALLRSEYAAINLLGGLPLDGLSYIPYPNPEKLSLSLTTFAPGRTDNLGPQDLAELLVEAFRWIYEIAPQLQNVLEEIIQKKSQALFEARCRLPIADQLAQLKSLPHLERALGTKVVAIRRGLRDGPTIDSITATCYAAAFIIIAAMNARRKDEIQHPFIGLFSGCLETIDDGLGLYVCEFYIEKTVQTYAPFYVNESTRDSIRMLEKFREIASRAVALNESPKEALSGPRGPALFAMPDIFRGVSTFNFGARLRGKDSYTGRMFNLSSGVELKAHMLRRAHALLHHYRYESSSLQAICQQLRHRDIETTQIYVSDTAVTAIERRGAHLYRRLTVSQAAALEAERLATESDKSSVGQEKLVAFVSDVLHGRSRATGGFVKLVQRFHQILGKSLSYAEMDKARQGETLGRALIQRGYAPQPLWHATCMVGSARSAAYAGCRSALTGAAEQEKASPSVCMSCPHQQLTLQHVENMRLELMNLRNELQRSVRATLVARRIEGEIRLLEQALGLAVRRFEKTERI